MTPPATTTPTGTAPAKAEKTFFSKMRYNIANKAISYVALPLMLVSNITNPFKNTNKPSAVLGTNEYHVQMNAKLADMIVLQETGAHYESGNQKIDDAINNTKISGAELKEEVEAALPSHLTLDQQFAKADKKDLLQAVWPQLQKEIQDIKTAPSAAYDRDIAPLIGDSYDNIKITSHFQKMRHMKYVDRKTGEVKKHFTSHPAIDFKLKMASTKETARHNQVGEKLNAPDDMKIIYSNDQSGKVVGRDKYNFTWTYFDVKSVKQSKLGYHLGDSVKAGEAFIKIDAPREGQVNTGAHAHLMVKDDKGRVVNPEKFVRNDGYMGKIEKSPLAKELGPELVAMIRTDPTGETFANVSITSKGAKITPNWVASAAMQRSRNKEGGVSEKTKTNRGITESFLVSESSDPVMKEFAHRGVMNLNAQEINKVYVHIQKMSGIDSLLTPVDDVNKQAERLAMVPQQLDAMINHNSSNATKMTKKAHGDHRVLGQERADHVAPLTKLDNLTKQVLFDRYQEMTDLGDQIEMSIKKNDGYLIEDMATVKALVKNEKVDKVLEKKEKDVFVSQWIERNQQVAQLKAEVDRTNLFQDASPVEKVKSLQDADRLAGIKQDFRQMGEVVSRPSVAFERRNPLEMAMNRKFSWSYGV